MLDEIIKVLETDIPLLDIPIKNILFLVLVLVVGYFATIFIS